MLCSSLYIPVGNLQQKMCIFTDELILSVQYMYLSRGHLMGGGSPILDVVSPLTRVGRIMLQNLPIILFPDSHNFTRATVYLLLLHYCRARIHYR